MLSWDTGREFEGAGMWHGDISWCAPQAVRYRINSLRKAKKEMISARRQMRGRGRTREGSLSGQTVGRHES